MKIFSILKEQMNDKDLPFYQENYIYDTVKKDKKN